ncbi:glycosyltransferase family 2 protein [Vibrio sp. WJH972]
MKISAVITTYNRPDFFYESVSSVLRQTRPADEIIVIDDCSTTSYENVLTSLPQDRIVYVRLPEPGGANKARNHGVALSSGSVICFLDDDDIWKPDYLAKHQKSYLEGADAVVSGFDHFGSSTTIHIQKTNRVTCDGLRTGNPYCGMSGFSAKRVLLESLKFDETLTNGQDWDMYVRLYQQGIDFHNIAESIYFYRYQTPDGISTKVVTMNVEDIQPRFRSAEKHREFLGDYYYKQRINEQLLFCLKHKKNKLSWILKAIQLTGIRMTITHFYKRFSLKVSHVPCNTDMAHSKPR